MKVGIVGCGCISSIYLENISNMYKNIEVAGVCDLIAKRAEDQAAKFGVKRIYKDMYEMFADPDVDIILNITRPYDHYGVTKAALLAGKHVYSEKPLATTTEDAKELIDLALEKGLYLGGAPDTFMGAGIQTCRRLIDEGAIGKLVGAVGFFLGRGPEGWHPDPEFFYKKGGGPMLDMGPYYTTCLVNLLGPAESVMAYGLPAIPERVVGSGEHKGEKISVEIDTFTTGTIRFKSGICASFTASFATYAERSHLIEIYGEEGSILVPDPNCFGGPILMRHGFGPYEEVPVDEGFTRNSRALGLSEMASAIEAKRFHVANYKQQYHVLEIMTAFEKSSKANAPIKIEGEFEQMPLINPDMIEANYRA